MSDQEPCTCAPCSPVNVDVVCQTFAQSLARFNDASNHAAAMSLSVQQNLQSMFNVKAQQTLERDSGERMASMSSLLGNGQATMLSQLAAVNERVAGIAAKLPG